MCLSTQDPYKANFCAECGKSKSEASLFCKEVIAQNARKKKEKKIRDSCPYKERWEKNRRTELLDAWVFNEYENNKHYMVRMYKKKNGEWPKLFEEWLEEGNYKPIPWTLKSGKNKGEVVDRGDKLEQYREYQQSFPEEYKNYHPGAVVVMGKEYNLHQRNWIFNYEVKLLTKIAQQQYISISLLERIKDHFERKYRDSNSARDMMTNFANPSNRKFGTYASGPFTPINLHTRKPEHISYCEVCGDPISVLYFNLTEDDDHFDLEEEWDVKEFAQKNLVCGNTLCNEVIQYQKGDLSNYVNQKTWDIKPQRISQKKLHEIPKELRGTAILARFIDFEARYKSKDFEMGEFKQQ